MGRKERVECVWYGESNLWSEIGKVRAVDIRPAATLATNDNRMSLPPSFPAHAGPVNAAGLRSVPAPTGTCMNHLLRRLPFIPACTPGSLTTRSALPLSKLALLFLLASLTVQPARADMYRPQATPGGIDARPSINSLSPSGSNLVITLQGLQAPYQVQMRPGLSSSAWITVTNAAVAWPSNQAAVTLRNIAGNQNFFRLCMAGNRFMGVDECDACHDDKVSVWQTTAHASAYSCFSNTPAALLPSCVVCHDVGYGQPTGFVNTNSTPGLANVGCEACHGPGGAHLLFSSSKYRPVNTVAAEVCGGCHSGAHHPTFDEWTSSAHAAVVPDVAASLTPDLAGNARQMSCGPCHSGATRVAMLNNYRDQQAGSSNALALPSASDAVHYGQTCVVCHDPHATNGAPFQLRNPLASTNDYFYVSSSVTLTNYTTNSYPVHGVWTNEITTNVVYLNTGFATQYVAGVQICAQCHNSRGAKWTDTARAPHTSAQYNMLLGTVGELPSGLPHYQPATHALAITNQCVGCHMQNQPSSAGTGHAFKVQSYDLCVTCHGPNASNLVTWVTGSLIPSEVQQLKSALDLWATTKAPATLRAKYGALAWEYTTPGSLSSGAAGPSAAEQAQIPDGIKKARFNLYLVNNDPGAGVHNPFYVVDLLNAATAWVQTELGQ